MLRTMTSALMFASLMSAVPVHAAESASHPMNAVTVAPSSAPTVLVGKTDWASTALKTESPEHTRGVLLPALYVSLGALNAFDAYSTRVGLSRGAIESNQLMQSAAGNSATMWAVKGGTTALSILIAERLWRKNRRAEAIVSMLISNGLMAAVAAHNGSVLRRVR